MAERDAVFEVTAKDNTSPALSSAARGMDNLGDEADTASRKVKGLEKQAGELARQMLAAKVAMASLAAEFDRTGDMDIYKKFRVERTKMTQLTGISKAITAEMDAGFQGAMSLPSLGYVGAGIGATMAIPMMAAITGAMAAGVGGGVAGLGLMGAYLGNPEAVKSVATSTVQDLKRQLIAATGEFRQPLLATLADVPRMVQSWGLDKALKNAVPYVNILYTGFDKMGAGVSRGVTALTSRAQPAVEALAGGMAELGDAAGDAMDAMSEGAEGGAEAMRDVIFLTADLVRGLGEVAGAAGKAYAWVDENPWTALQATSGLALPLVLLTQFSDKTDNVTGAARRLAPAVDAASGSMRGLADVAQTAADGFDRAFNEMMGLDTATLAVKEGWLSLREELTTGTRTLDQNTAAGQENAKAVLDQIGLIDARMKKEIEAGNATPEAEAAARAAYAATVGQLRGMLIQLGYNAAEVDRLIGKYEELAKPRTLNFTTVFRQVGTAPSGQGDQKSGHSRNSVTDFGSLGDWRPAAFAASGAGQRFEGPGLPSQLTFTTGGPRDVSVAVENTLFLDGAPVRAIAQRTTAEAFDERSYRAWAGWK